MPRPSTVDIFTETPTGHALHLANVPVLARHAIVRELEAAGKLVLVCRHSKVFGAFVYSTRNLRRLGLR